MMFRLSQYSGLLHQDMESYRIPDVRPHLVRNPPYGAAPRERLIPRLRLFGDACDGNVENAGSGD